MKKVKVKIFEDSMGNILGYPIRQDLQEKIKNHLQDMNVYPDHRFFYQDGMGAEDFKQDLSQKQIKEIESGYDIYLNIDPWILGHFYGYDTHTIFE